MVSESVTLSFQRYSKRETALAKRNLNSRNFALQRLLLFG